MSEVAVIMNPAAAGGKPLRLLPAVEAKLSALGLSFRVEPTTSLEHAGNLARAAADVGAIVAGFGGDGLIGAIAGALAGGDGVLAVIPGGRGNDFARTLGIPRTAVEACDVLARGTRRRVDLGRAGGRVFIGIASCGFDSEANRLANEARWIRGNLVYTYAALRALSAWRPARFEVELDGGERRVFTGYSVAAANAKAYGGGMYLAPEASLDDGQLDVVTMSHVSKPRHLRLLPLVFSGRHVAAAHVDVVRARSIRISADRPFAVYADGDPIAELPVEIEALPGALQVIAP